MNIGAELRNNKALADAEVSTEANNAIHGEELYSRSLNA